MFDHFAKLIKSIRYRFLIYNIIFENIDIFENSSIYIFEKILSFSSGNIFIAIHCVLNIIFRSVKPPMHFS